MKNGRMILRRLELEPARGKTNGRIAQRGVHGGLLEHLRAAQIGARRRHEAGSEHRQRRNEPHDDHECDPLLRP